MKQQSVPTLYTIEFYHKESYLMDHSGLIKNVKSKKLGLEPYWGSFVIAQMKMLIHLEVTIYKEGMNIGISLKLRKWDLLVHLMKNY